MNKRFSTKSKSSRLVDIHFSLPGVGVGHCQVVTRSGTAFCRCKMRQFAISNLAMMSLCLHYLVEKCISRRLEDNQIQNKIRLVEDITKICPKTSSRRLEIVNMSLRYYLKTFRPSQDILKTSSRCLETVLRLCLKNVLKTCWGCLETVLRHPLHWVCSSNINEILLYNR